MEAEKWVEEIDKCKNSFEYFYTNYFKVEGMPAYSEELHKEWLQQRYVIGRGRKGQPIYAKPLTPDECFKIK